MGGLLTGVKQMKCKFIFLLLLCVLLYSCVDVRRSPRNRTSSEAETVITFDEVDPICIICERLITDIDTNENEEVIVLRNLSTDDFIISPSNYSPHVIFLEQSWRRARPEGELRRAEPFDEMPWSMILGRDLIENHFDDIIITTAMHWGATERSIVRIIITGKGYRTFRGGFTIDSSITGCINNIW